METSYKTFSEEQTAVRVYVNKNPYPSKEAIEKVLLENNRYYEYSEHTYPVCKIIYENITDDKVVLEGLKYIYKRGGSRAVMGNYSILCNWSPLNVNLITKSYAVCIKHQFQDNW